ncbi:hypothetical protein [Thermococcus sp.]
MGKLDELFEPEKEPERDSDRIEVIEELVNQWEFKEALKELDRVKLVPNMFLGLRVIVRGVLTAVKESMKEGKLNEDIRKALVDYVESLIPIANGITNLRLKALAFADISVAFYMLDENLKSDLALKTALNIATEIGDDDITVEIVKTLIDRGILAKAAYAMNLVRNRKKLDLILSQLAVMFYASGEQEKAEVTLQHIESRFHRANALYYMASIEASRDQEKALRLLDAAFRIVEEIENPVLRFEMFLKLTELKSKITGEGSTKIDFSGPQ